MSIEPIDRTQFSAVERADIRPTYALGAFGRTARALFKGLPFFSSLNRAFDTARLLDALRKAQLEVLKHKTELKAAHAKIERLQNIAFTDNLTGLSNRQKADIVIRELHDAKTPVAVIAFDLDHFKNINDTYGHPGGDEVLRHVAALTQSVAAVIKANTREEDFAIQLNEGEAFRWGGEEFVIFLPMSTLQQAKSKAEKLRVVLENTLCLFNDEYIKVTASFGVAFWDPTSNETIKQAMTRADNASYASKNGGRNQVTVAETFSDESHPVTLRPTKAKVIKHPALRKN